jgi:hypothetical protein
MAGQAAGRPPEDPKSGRNPLYSPRSERLVSPSSERLGIPRLKARLRRRMTALGPARSADRETGDRDMKSLDTRSGARSRKHGDQRAGAVTALWIGLLAIGVLATGPQAAAAPPPATPKSAPLPTAPFAYPAAMNSGAGLRTVTRSSKPGQIVGEDLFAHSGNRNGLTSAVSVEARGADLWLAAPAPAPVRDAPSPNGEAAPATSQGSPSSVASR